jgi:hypothetical protein
MLSKGDTVTFKVTSPYFLDYKNKRFTIKDIHEIKALDNSKLNWSLSMDVREMAQKALKNGNKFFVAEFENHPEYSTLYPITHLKKISY